MWNGGKTSRSLYLEFSFLLFHLQKSWHNTNPKSKHSELIYYCLWCMCEVWGNFSDMISDWYMYVKYLNHSVALLLSLPRQNSFYVPTALVNQALRITVGLWSCTERTLILPQSHKAYPKIRSARMSL